MADLTIKRGDNERLKSLVTPASAIANGVTFMAKRRLSDADGAAVITKTIGSGIAIVTAGTDVPPVPAELQISIDSADTKVLENKTTVLLYEIEDGNDHTLDSGRLIVQPEVRQA